MIEVSWIRQFQSLQELIMDNTGMREFPDDFFTGLTNLKYLKISHTNAPNLTERTVNLEKLDFAEVLDRYLIDFDLGVFAIWAPTL